MGYWLIYVHIALDVIKHGGPRENSKQASHGGVFIQKLFKLFLQKLFIDLDL